MMNREMIMKELENRGYKVEPITNVKNGVDMDGIIFKIGTICPVLYPNSYIEEAENYDLTLEEVVDKIEEDVRGLETPYFDIEKLTDPQFVLENVFIGVQKESAEDLIKRESELEGIESYLYVQCSEEGSFKLKTHQWESYGLTEEELWERAEENTRRNIVIKSMASVISEMMGVEIEEDEVGSFYVVSNSSKFRGASGVLDRELIKGFADKIGAKGFAILPSSIHEMLLLPFKDEGEVDMRMLNEMVWQVNHTEVAPEERLTDRAYMYQF